jgi:RNA polymerase sigma factor (sigma-70 family)
MRSIQVIDFNPHLGYKDEIIMSYMGLARKTAGRFKWAVYRSPNITLQDLVSEAIIGLIKAFHNFDPDKFGGQVRKFTTYAVPMIEGELRQFIYKHGEIFKVPISMYTLGGAILRNDLLHAPIIDIMEKTGCSELEAARVIKYLHETKAVSLDQPINLDDGIAEVQDFFGTENDFSGIEVSEFLTKLNETELSFVKMRLSGETHRVEADDLLPGIREKLIAYTGLIESEVNKMSVELTKEKYLEAKKQRLSDEQICSEFQLGPSSLYRKKCNWGLSGNGRGKSVTKKSNNQNANSSLNVTPNSNTELKATPETQKVKSHEAVDIDLLKDRLVQIENENSHLKALLKLYM